MTDHSPQGAPGALPEALVTALARDASLVRAPAKQMLIWPDERSTHVYRVIQGRVQVTLMSPAGRQVILRDLGPGDLFGELAAIDQEPRSASIFALDDCVLAVIAGPVFCEAIYRSPAAAEWLARRLTHQVRDLTGRLFERDSLRVSTRLHCEILRLCGAGGNGRDPHVIDPAPTHMEFAARIGSHREAVTREMAYLVKRGIVQTQRRRVTVSDLPGLVNMVRAATGHPSLEPRGESFASDLDAD